MASLKALKNRIGSVKSTQKITKAMKMVAAASLLVPVAVHAQTTSPLNGNWTVDLTAKPTDKPTDKPYTQPMTLNLAADGTVTGSFYQSTIEAGRWKTDRGRTCVSFRTSDGVGPYHTAACLVGTRVQGQTWAEHRKFVFNWNAVRKK